ncbi:hypothetical protein DRH14_02160 [Candidatus Shapirobacteria bacterium]|nr:MAG: hypothetical protein DRH14_02160 [Candidatus Shapirobacteria bacterium]
MLSLICTFNKDKASVKAKPAVIIVDNCLVKLVICFRLTLAKNLAKKSSIIVFFCSPTIKGINKLSLNIDTTSPLLTASKLPFTTFPCQSLAL